MDNPKIINLPTKKLLGIWVKMSLAENKTGMLWGKFMPRRKEIKNTVSNDLYSMQVYEPSLEMKDFNLKTTFVKWAAIEVTDFDTIPKDMESYTLIGGKYVVFRHKGTLAGFVKTTNYIYNEWLPNSEYILDAREHFEILGENYYGPNDPNSEEDVWIPIRDK